MLDTPGETKGYHITPTLSSAKKHHSFASPPPPHPKNVVFNIFYKNLRLHDHDHPQKNTSYSQ